MTVLEDCDSLLSHANRYEQSKQPLPRDSTGACLCAGCASIRSTSTISLDSATSKSVIRSLQQNLHASEMQKLEIAALWKKRTGRVISYAMGRIKYYREKAEEAERKLDILGKGTYMNEDEESKELEEWIDAVLREGIHGA